MTAMGPTLSVSHPAGAARAPLRKKQRVGTEKRRPRPAEFREQGFEKDAERIERAIHEEHDDVSCIRLQ
jgi:hypothetical protein